MSKGIRVVLWSFGCEGKSTLLYEGFKGIKNAKLIPTIGFNEETINFKGLSITFWDIGGGCGVKELRNNYFRDFDALIYLIDSSTIIEHKSHSDFTDNFEELKKCIKIIDDMPLLIAITKIDKRQLSTYDIINNYELDKLFNRKNKFGIIECSSFTGQGIKEILFWLNNLVKK